MGTHSPLPAAVLRLIREQEGVLTRDQLLGLGMTDTRIRRYLSERHWARLGSGLYYAGPADPAWLSLAWAGVLLAGEGSALSRESAARLWGLHAHESTPLTVRVPAGRRRVQRDDRWYFERTRLDFRSVGSPPRLRIEPTILDLCAAEPERAVHWVTAGVGTRRTTAGRIRRELETMPRHPLRRLLTDLLADVDEGAQSRLEMVYLRDVERAHGLPVGRRQILSGGYRIDVSYEYGLVVELDGRLGHDGIGLFRDMHRDNFHTLRGLRTLRFGWHDCRTDPCIVAAAVGSLLKALGWPGTITPCRRCRSIVR